MSRTLPCPNPTCTHVFSPQDVRGVTSLTCPQCGTVFRFRAVAGAPAAKPAHPRRKAAPAAAPVARPVEAEPEPVVIVPPRSRRRAAPGGRRWVLVPLIVGLLVLVVAGGAGWLFRDAWLGGGPSPDEDTPPVESRPMNYRFRPPGAPWAEDRAVLRELGASFALRRTDPNAWFAVVVKDYKDRNPRDDELEREAVTRLRKLFSKKGVEYEHRDEDSWTGLAAQRFVFTAENNSNVAQTGECLMVVYNGIAYWFFGWTPSAAGPAVLADVQQQWRDIRQGFSLLKEREGWVGKQPEIIEAEGQKASYRVSYTKGLWERGEGPDADLLLQGRDPDNPQDARKWAWVRVYVRPATGDPEAAMAAARAFVEEHEKQLYPEVKLEPMSDAGRGGLAEGAVELGKARAQLQRLRVQKAEDYEHFFAVAAVPRPVNALVIVCECAWPQRELWEQRFGPVLHSLRFDKK